MEGEDTGGGWTCARAAPRGSATSRQRGRETVSKDRSWPGRFFQELRRRRVFRVAAAYGVVGFVLAQAADLLFKALNLPPAA
jgi:hypothetical protein